MQLIVMLFLKRLKNYARLIRLTLYLLSISLAVQIMYLIYAISGDQYAFVPSDDIAKGLVVLYVIVIMLFILLFPHSTLIVVNLFLFYVTFLIYFQNDYITCVYGTNIALERVITLNEKLTWLYSFRAMDFAHFTDARWQFIVDNLRLESIRTSVEIHKNVYALDAVYTNLTSNKETTGIFGWILNNPKSACFFFLAGVTVTGLLCYLFYFDFDIPVTITLTDPRTGQLVEQVEHLLKMQGFVDKKLDLLRRSMENAAEFEELLRNQEHSIDFILRHLELIA